MNALYIETRFALNGFAESFHCHLRAEFHGVEEFDNESMARWLSNVMVRPLSESSYTGDRIQRGYCRHPIRGPKTAIYRPPSMAKHGFARMLRTDFRL